LAIVEKREEKAKKAKVKKEVELAKDKA